MLGYSLRRLPLISSLLLRPQSVQDPMQLSANPRNRILIERFYIAVMVCFMICCMIPYDVKKGTWWYTAICITNLVLVAAAITLWLLCHMNASYMKRVVRTPTFIKMVVILTFAGFLSNFYASDDWRQTYHLTEATMYLLYLSGCCMDMLKSIQNSTRRIFVAVAIVGCLYGFYVTAFMDLEITVFVWGPLIVTYGASRMAAFHALLTLCIKSVPVLATDKHAQYFVFGDSQAIPKVCKRTVNGRRHVSAMRASFADFPVLRSGFGEPPGASAPFNVVEFTGKHCPGPP